MNDQKIHWMFIEYISQRDVDNLTTADMEEAIINCSYISFVGYTDQALAMIWENAIMDVAYP